MKHKTAEAEVAKFLSSLERRGMRLDLEPLRQNLNRLGNPQKTMRTILVAGTNGKGSTSAMIASILAAAGFRVGLYTSPHLIDFRERIRVNERTISWKELLAIIEDVRGYLDEGTTYFEFATIAALLHFHRCQVDMVVLEVGMGGRLDATNVVDPEVSVITNISLEHTPYLGHTLADITREKAGIVRSQGICITASRNAKVLSTLRDICHERQAELLRVGRDVKVQRKADGTFEYAGLRRQLADLVLPLTGRHQLSNAATALAVAEKLVEGGMAIEAQAFRRGLAATRWEGRLEYVLRDPPLLVDGAHNPAGVAVLAEALRRDFRYRRLILIVGILKDKACGAMLRKLAPLTSTLILTGLATPRSQTPEALAVFAARYFQQIVIRRTTEAALDYALAQAGQDDLICAAGSLFLVGEVKKIIGERSRSCK